MTRRILATVGAAAVVCVSAFAMDLPVAWRAWRYSRAIQITAASSPTFCQAHVATNVFPHAQAALGDVRIIDETGAEVPFTVNVERGGTKSETRQAMLRENSFVPGQYTQVLVDLGKDPAFHNAVKVSTTGTDFMNWVQVEASDDSRVWRVVKLRAPISRFQREGLSGNQTVRYSQNNARYLRLRIFEAAHQFPVTSAEVYFNSETVEPVRETVPIKLVADSSGLPSITRWNADFASGAYPLSEVEFQTAQEGFFRGVRVQTSEDGKDWEFAGGGETYRYRLGEKTEESLRVPVYGSRASRYWRVEVLNQNDAPLEGLSARFVMNTRRVYFEQKPGHAYRLLYGNERAMTPRYDLERLVEVSAKPQAAAVQAELGPEEVTSNYLDSRPFTERHPNLLWLALGIAVILLAYAATRSLKQPAPQS